MMPDFSRLLNEASTIASDVDTLFFFILALAVLFSLGIACFIIYFGIKYRRRAEDELAEQIVGSNKLELTWTLIPLGLAMIVFYWGANLYFRMSTPPNDALQVYVVGKQWIWEIQHEEGKKEINELHVPVGQAVRLTMTSQDVIHSFFVPAFRVKQDALPGRYTTEWFQATTPGQFELFCAEYCGTSHSTMGGFVIVMTPQEYQNWLATNPTEGTAASGAQLFQQFGCSTCHQPDGSGLGPPLVGVFGSTVKLQAGGTVVADENYLRESILNPDAKIVAGYQPVMPSFEGQLSEQQLLQLIAYIKTLK